jgi:hypothetical protein
MYSKCHVSDPIERRIGQLCGVSKVRAMIADLVCVRSSLTGTSIQA